MTYDLTTPQILKETAAGMQRYSILDQMLANRQIECTGEITAASVNALIRQIRYLAQEDPGAPITLYINSPGGEVTSGLALYDVMQATAASVNALIRQIRYLAQEDPGAPITLYINSPGGEVTSGLALYDVMQAVPCPIRTVCTGTAASMAAVLFAAGSQRDMLPHAEVMIHDPLMQSCPGGSALQMKSLGDRLMRMAAVLFAAGSQRDMLPHAEVMIHDPLMQSCPGGSALQMKSLGDRLMRTRRIIGQVLAEHTHHPLEEIYEKTCQDSFFGAEEAVAFGLADRIITQL